MNAAIALPIERNPDPTVVRIVAGWVAGLSGLTAISLFVLGAFAAGIVCLSITITSIIGAILGKPDHVAYIISAVASAVLVLVSLAVPISGWIVHKV